ncbi:hypothetical protein PUR61_10945 [Streptomyces sp. BE20]|uniref:hypothetical protein n=1 Tax=Streptomyces sp. BE20 TaxID=3002525 RepID=UPI002E76DCBB|nr:hypothetical protein [Streptomyces sp. BE20]MEE1822705.1 hypothetical protein [Streptomyces sp. BE20]
MSTTGAERGTARGTELSERLLDAGAVLPPGTLPGAGAPDGVADVLTARSYAHPVLGERRIVRLVPGALGPAEDLAVDFLGLVPAGEPAEVGQVRQEALGFPAWALVHDPANGHHALALVKEMERLARQAKSKPGHAKDGFEELAKRLGRAVPHFLPTYCEQVGRIFLEQGNQTYASTFFGKARDAERTHNLTVDEERLRAVFLEFALAGALTVKALRQYVKELSVRLDPVTAWQRFSQLCTERSAAGMAPYAGVAEDARALLRAAGLDRDEHERVLLAELLASPAVNRAPTAFWKSWHDAVIELARRDDTVRARLLEILPDPAGSDDRDGQDTAWLTVLSESGADRLLTDVTGSAAPAGSVEPIGGGAPAEPAAAWLQRWVNHLGRGWRDRGLSAETLALAARMAARLRAEAVPVDLFTGVRRSATQIELLDLLLAEGVPVADPSDGHTFHLSGWVQASGTDGRDLAAVAADARFRPSLRAAVPDVWKAAGTKGVTAVPVLRELFVEWSDARADELAAVRGLSTAVGLLRGLSSSRAAIRTENPAAAERIAALDVAGLLARSLRTGILDELGWPALEEALARLGVKKSEAPGFGDSKTLPEGLILEDAWPHLILVRGDQALVVGAEGILLEHAVRIPDKQESWQRPRFRFVDGELLVAWFHERKQRAYWSSRPAEIFDLGGATIAYYYGGSQEPDQPSLPLPGGGRSTGERPLHPGDTRMPEEYQVLGDGTGYWTVRHGRGTAALTELDPATGTLGRAAEPPRIAATAAAGRLDVRRTLLLPLRPGLEDTPLGTDGSAVGSWLRVEGGRVTTGTADGTTLVLHNTRDHAKLYPLGRLGLPGGAHPLLVELPNDHLAFVLPTDGATATGTVAGPAVVEGDAAGATADVRFCRPGGRGAAGTALVPPLPYWHVLRPRDEEGSRHLRTVTAEQAARLIDAAWPVDAEPVPEERQLWLTTQGVRRRLVSGKKAKKGLPVQDVAGILPGIGDRLLLAGVTGLARTAADLLDTISRYVPQPEAEAEASADSGTTAFAYRPEHGSDYDLGEAVTLLLPDIGGFGRNWERSANWRVLNNLRAVTAVLAAPPAATGESWTTPHRIKLHGDDNHHGWLHLLGRLGTAAYAAAAPLTSDAARASLALLLTELTAGPLADRGATVREVTLTEPLTDPKATKGKHEKRAGQVWRHGERTVVILGCRHHENDRVHWLAVDHDPSGAFGQVAHFGAEQERSTEETLTADWVTRFTALLALHGGIPHRAERAADFGDRSGIGAVRATLLLSPTAALVQWYGAPLPADRLKEYGLKSSEAKAARDWVRDRDRTVLTDVWAALLPADPASLWTDGPDTAAAAALWTERLGRLVTLPEEIQATVSGATIAHIEEILNVARTPWLSRTTRHRLRPEEDDGSLRLRPDDPAALPAYDSLTGAVDAVRWLAYHLPYESPLRPSLPGAAVALRARLADPELLLSYGYVQTVKGRPVSEVLRSRFGLPVEGGADADGLVRCGDAVVLSPGHGDEQIWLRPAGLTGADDPVLELLGGLAEGYGFADQVLAIRTIVGGELDRLAALPGAGPAPDPDGADGAADADVSWPHHPQVSVPDLVAEVAKTHELGEDAAALYLQLLALPDPTDRNAARWTGWKPARLKRARAELAGSGLVLEAKRARAGRTLFLPGGWQEAKTPALPAETWKAGLYELPTHRTALPRHAVPELFTRAWQRVTDGDTPGYEELQTGKRRKARR